MYRSKYGDIELVPLDRFNWEECVHLQLDPKQKEFIPDNLFSLAQSRFEKSIPYGICYMGKVVGMAIVTIWDHVYWINRIMIDANFQRKGIGSKAIKLILSHLELEPACHEIRASVSRENIWGQYFFESEGFKQIGEELEGEVVMRFVKPD